MLRITTGTAKNVRLSTPDFKEYRGVKEVVKQSVFSVIGEEIKNKDCLELFAGSGNIGLEALSRGARTCHFVDENPKAIEVIEKNAIKCKFDESKVQIFKSNAVKFVANTINKYDIIFLDPFYQDTSHIFLVKSIEEIIKNKGVIVFFHGNTLDINKIIKDTNFKILDQRKFGNSYFSLIS